MKKTLLILCFSLVSVVCFAQQLNVQAGLANGSFRAKVDADGASASASEGRTGFYVGLGTDFKVSDKVAIAPSALFSIIDESNFLQIPVVLKYYASEKFNIQAGPQGSFILEETGDFVNSFGLDLAFGLGYDINENFFVNARYSLELTNRTPDASEFSDIDPDFPSGVDVKTTYNTLLIGLGYRFN